MKQKFLHFEGASALLASALIYATFGILIREIAKMMGDVTQTFVRFLLAAAIITVVNLVVRKKLRVSTSVLLKSALLGLLFAALVVLFTISVNSTKIANSVFLIYAGGIVSSFLIGTFFLKEKVTRPKMVAIAIALVGLSMYSGAFLALSTGVVAGLCAGLLDGVANSVRKTLKSADRNTVVMYQYAIGAFFALVAVLASGGFVVGAISILPVLATVLFAVLMLFLSNLLLFGFQHFDVNVGTVILATEILFATLLGYLFFRETPTTQEFVGGMLIFVASIVASVDIPRIFARIRRFA